MKFLDAIGVSTLWEAVKDLINNSTRGYRIGDIVLSDGSVVPADGYSGHGDDAVGVLIEPGSGKLVRKNYISGYFITRDNSYKNDAIRIFNDNYSARDSFETGLDVLSRCELEVYKLSGESAVGQFQNYFPVMFNLKYASNPMRPSMVHVASVLEVQYILSNSKILLSISKIGGNFTSSTLIRSCSWDRNSECNVLSKSLLDTGVDASTTVRTYLAIDYLPY